MSKPRYATRDKYCQNERWFWRVRPSLAGVNGAIIWVAQDNDARRALKREIVAALGRDLKKGERVKLS